MRDQVSIGSACFRSFPLVRCSSMRRLTAGSVGEITISSRLVRAVRSQRFWAVEGFARATPEGRFQVSTG